MSSVLLINANANHIPIADNSVHLVVTSPPYYGLRLYQDLPPQIWGGEAGCAHEFGDEPDASRGMFCARCGAWRGFLGNESSPFQYIEHIVEICRELRRVLRADGQFWLNLGDSFAGSGGAGGDYAEGGLREGQPRYKSNFEIVKSKRNASRWGGKIFRPRVCSSPRTRC